jgi:hypothetical protein
MEIDFVLAINQLTGCFEAETVCRACDEDTSHVVQGCRVGTEVGMGMSGKMIEMSKVFESAEQGIGNSVCRERSVERSGQKETG